MKKSFIMILCAALTLLSTSASSKTLVVYYSYTNYCREIVTTLISQTETELKYETVINSAALLVDGIENPHQIGKVEFTFTLMDKPKGKFDLSDYGGEFTVPYSNNTIHRVELKTNDKGEITFSSDDKEVVTVKNKAGYGYDDNCIITLIKPGTTTVRAYIDGIEVDSMEVVVNKLDQDLKVTYKGKSSVTFKADDLKKEMKKIALTIKGVKTKITATKSSTSLYFIPSTKQLTLYKGIKKGDYTLKVKAEADKYYNSKSVKFTIHIE